MLALNATTFHGTAEALWDEIEPSASLLFVAAPLQYFKPLLAGDLDRQWVVGKTYPLKLSLFGFLPIGERRITLVTIDRKTNLLVVLCYVLAFLLIKEK
jgi:hypothetical protein